MKQSEKTGVAGPTGPIGMDWQGTWVSGNYTNTQGVYYAVDGKSYICKLDTVSNEVPTNATYWDVLSDKGATGATGADGDITWQGTWVSGNYVVNQAVHYAVDGQAYVCKLNTVSNEVPTNTTYWDILVTKGDAGTNGTNGTGVWSTTTAKSAAFTAADGNLYLVDSSGGTIAITMPASPSDGDVFRVKDSTGNFGTNNVTLTRAGSESIEGIAGNKILQTNWGSYTIVSDGTNWFLING